MRRSARCNCFCRSSSGTARIESRLRRAITDEYGDESAIGVIDGSAHAKQGDKTPGVQRQWCGESGKIDNCVVGQHLIYTDNDAKNPFSACIASDVYLPESWINDPVRRKRAHIPEDAVFRTKWQIAADQVDACLADGIRFSWITCDEEYTSVPEFIYRMDRSGQRVIGEVRSNFRCWATRPACRSTQAAHTSKQVNNLCRFSPAFRKQPWRRVHIKDTTRGACVWEIKSAGLPGGQRRRGGVASDGPLVLADHRPQYRDGRDQVLRQQCLRKHGVGGDAESCLRTGAWRCGSNAPSRHAALGRSRCGPTRV